jgi:hypothetical protein
MGMAPRAQTIKLTIVENATQKNVSGPKNWAAVRKDATFAIVEATTSPKNNDEAWKAIKWSGDAGEPVPGNTNRRKLSLAASKRYHVEAELGGAKDQLDLWVVWATIEVKTSGPRPARAAPFDPGTRDKSDQLGPVTYKSLSSSVIDEEAGTFVDNMGASGKVAPVATLTPKGVSKVVKAGWGFERQVWSHNWSDGQRTKQYNDAWTRDTSAAAYLRLTPDDEDKIYDLDAPDIRWGQFSYESYNNFRQWIEWNQQRCSEYAPWYWQAVWVLDRDMSKQIRLNDLGVGNKKQPEKPAYPPPKSR